MPEALLNGESTTIDRTDPYMRLNPVPNENYTREEIYRHTRAPVDPAVTLILDAYTSREFFEIEREKVFAASWVVVGFTSQVEESGQVIVVLLSVRAESWDFLVFVNLDPDAAPLNE